MYDMQRLKELRKKNGYSIYDMGKFLNITPAFYWQIEKGQKRLYYDMAIRMAAIFHMKPDDIFIGD